MKYLSSRFEEYVGECEKNNLHENMKNVFNKIQVNNSNLIFYGLFRAALNYSLKMLKSRLRCRRDGFLKDP